MAKFVLSFDSKKLISILPSNVVKEDTAWSLTVISSRYIETEELPRIGDHIIYPFFDLAGELKWWVHQNIRFEVEAVIHNPIRVISFHDRPPIEREGTGSYINTTIKVTPLLLPLIL